MSGSYTSGVAKNFPKLNADGISGGKFVVVSKSFNAGDASSNAFFIADRPCKILKISANSSIDASAQADFNVFKHTPAAPASVLNAVISLNGTGNAVVVDGVLHPTLDRLTLDVGNLLVVTLNGAATGMTDAVVSVQLQYLDF